MIKVGYLAELLEAVVARMRLEVIARRRLRLSHSSPPSGPLIGRDSPDSFVVFF